MKRSIVLHESRICADGWLLWLVFVLGALVLALALATTAAAGTAYYSLEGWFANGSETQSILFDLHSSISEANNDPFSLRTWQNGGTGVGETNTAGDVINAGGFDPVLSLHKIESDGSETPMASNDDHFGLDSQISWGTSGLTELPFGDYRLDLTAYGSTLGGRQRHWAVDLVGKSADLAHGIGNVTVLTGVDRSGITTLKSLKFGVTDTLLGAARVNIASGEALVVSGDFVMRDTGRADVDNGALVAGRVHINPGTEIYLLNGGTVSTSELVVEGILEGRTGAVILPDTGVLRNRGTIVIGDSFGLSSSTIVLPSGHYVQESSGALDIKIGGTGLADYGRLTILNGTAQLAGLIQVITVGGFVPSVGQSFEIITAADGFPTTFEPGNVILPDISSYGLGWATAYNYGPNGASMVLMTIALGTGSSSGTEDAIPEPGGLMLLALAAATWLVCRRRPHSGQLPGVAILLFVLTSPALAGEAYWSFEGWFADGSETQSFLFDVFSDIPNTDPFTLRTWQAMGTGAGQTNAAGDVISAGGFDSRLWLYDSADVLKATSDDGVGTGLDSLIGWNMPNLPPYSIPLQDPLPAGDYRLDLTAFNSTLLGRQPHWAVDLVGPSNRMMLTGVSHSGVTLLKSLKFGSVNPLLQYDGRVSLAADQSLVMSDDLVIQSNGHMYNYGLISAGNVDVEPQGWLDLHGGTLAAGSVVIRSESEIVYGALQGIGDMILPEGGALLNQGLVAPGHFYSSYQSGSWYVVGEGGIITVPSGNYEQDPSGTFFIGIGGTGPSESGQLDVLDGSASLGGALEAYLHINFLPALGDRFEILTAAGGLGGTEFATESLPHLAGGLYFDVLYSRDTVTLAVLGVLGDYNQNGVVDAADYTVWRDTLGSTTDLRANGDNSGASAGRIDQADYAVWKMHFGQTAGSGSAGASLSQAAIPEPVTWWLAVLGCVTVVLGGLRTRSRARSQAGRLTILACLALAGAALASGAANGDVFTWEAAPSNSNWNNALNWAGTANQFPDDATDTAIVDGANAIDPVLNLNVSVGTLSILNSGDVFLGDFSMLVTDTATVDGSGSSLDINDSPSIIDFDTNFLTVGAASGLATVTVHGAGALLQVDNTLTINGRGVLDIDGSRVQVGDDLVNSGFLSGDGVIQMTGIAGDDLINDGVIQATLSGTLRIERTAGSVSLFDWDGAGNSAADLFLDAFSTMDIDLPLSDTQFNGRIVLNNLSVLDVATAWSLHGGSATTDQGVLNKGSGASVGTVAGSPVTLLTGSEVNVNGGTLAFAANLTANAGSTVNVVTGAALQLDGTATFDAASNINPAGVWSLNVNGITTINQTNFNWDGTGALTNVTTAGPGASLNIVSDHIDLAGSDQFDATLNINSGTVWVDNLPNNWVMNGALNLDTAAGAAGLDGDPVNVWGSIHVTGGGIANINSDIRFENNPSVNVAADTDLELNGLATFASSTASFTGNGVLENEGGMQVLADTTINMPGGRFNLDGDTIGGPDDLVTLNSDLTLNVASIEDVSGNAFDDDMTIQGVAKLTVNLTDPADEWTMDGSMTISGPADPAFADNIGGSDFNLTGDATISGNSSWSARVDISGTVTLNANADLRLAGGSIADPNAIAGGTINGAMGTLRAITDKALVGFGTINANVDFDGTAELRADDGILTLNGTINDVGGFGTADVDGILDITNPWNTDVANIVELKGGEIRGGTITNDNAAGINGFGLVSSRVINNTSIDALGGGTLVVETPTNDNDWDGATNTGALWAASANLIIRDNATFPFLGTVMAWTGREVFVEGFALDFQPGSVLQLFDGTYRSDHATYFGGVLSVPGGSVGKLAVAGTFVFENGSSTTLSGDLRLENTVTEVQAGADFSGGGALINRPLRTLRLLDGVTSGDLAVLIQNEGTLELDASAGQVSAVDYEQTATGEWDVELGGTGLDDFDRLNLTGTAALAGRLNLSLIEGFFPTLGQTFNILSATGGVSNTFDLVVQPPTLPAAGLMLDVLYNPTFVQLLVTEFLPGDYNLNGVVDAADYTVWRDTLGAMVAAYSGADGDGDGDVDGNDYTVWKSHFGQHAGSGAGATAGLFDSADAGVPEPASLVLIGWGVIGVMLVQAAARRKTVPAASARISP